MARKTTLQIDIQQFWRFVLISDVLLLRCELNFQVPVNRASRKNEQQDFVKNEQHRPPEDALHRECVSTVNQGEGISHWFPQTAYGYRFRRRHSGLLGGSKIPRPTLAPVAPLS